jgi:mRNA interferase RelE/StbE
VKYKTIITNKALTDINKLDSVAKRKIKSKLLYLQSAPQTLSRPLTHSQLGQYRYRVGDYRIVFDLDKEKIIILRVGHRREIYKTK